MKKKIGAFGTGQFSLGTLVEGRPGTTIFQNPGGGRGGGGAGGGSHTRTRPSCPPGMLPYPCKQLRSASVLGAPAQPRTHTLCAGNQGANTTGRTTSVRMRRASRQGTGHQNNFIRHTYTHSFWYIFGIFWYTLARGGGGGGGCILRQNGRFFRYAPPQNGSEQKKNHQKLRRAAGTARRAPTSPKSTNHQPYVEAQWVCMCKIHATLAQTPVLSLAAK